MFYQRSDGTVFRLWTTYIDAPELFNRIKGNHLFEEIIPVVPFRRGWLGELSLISARTLSVTVVTHPKTPGVEKRMFDIEVVDVVKDGLDFIRRSWRSVLIGDGARDWLRHLDFRHCGRKSDELEVSVLCVVEENIRWRGNRRQRPGKR